MDELDWLVSHYGERAPTSSEADFFAGRPEVAGMAAEDGRIVMRPNPTLAPHEVQAVRRNEALRLFMRGNPQTFDFDLTPKQSGFFAGTEYGKNPQALRETIVARVLTGDPSIGEPSPAQIEAASSLRKAIGQQSAARRSVAPSAPAATFGLANAVDGY